MSPLINDATSALIRAIRVYFVNFAVALGMEEIRSRGWASVTFTGARHELAFCLEGEETEVAVSAFLSDLHAAEFSLRGHVLADIALVSHEQRPGWARIELEALTVEDS